MRNKYVLIIILLLFLFTSCTAMVKPGDHPSQISRYKDYRITVPRADLISPEPTFSLPEGAEHYEPLENIAKSAEVYGVGWELGLHVSDFTLTGLYLVGEKERARLLGTYELSSAQSNQINEDTDGDGIDDSVTSELSGITVTMSRFRSMEEITAELNLPDTAEAYMERVILYKDEQGNIRGFAFSTGNAAYAASVGDAVPEEDTMDFITTLLTNDAPSTNTEATQNTDN